MAKQNSKKDFKKSDEQLENVNEAFGSAGQWVETHSKFLTIIILLVIVLAAGFILVKRYVIEPNKMEANNENYKATDYFLAGNWEAAQNGDDAECIGFAAIADEYAMYQQGELASLYAGICCYKLGKYEEAIDYIQQFSAGDVMVDPAARQLTGDAYVQLGELEEAVKAFDAAAKSKNELIAPMSLKKAGLVYLELNDKEAAKKCFEQIKNNYPTAAEARDIDKYIQLAQ